MNEGFPAVLGNLWLGQDEAQVRPLHSLRALLLPPKRCPSRGHAEWPASLLPCPMHAVRAAAHTSVATLPLLSLSLFVDILVAPIPSQAVASALLPKLEKTRKEVGDLLFEVATLEVSEPIDWLHFACTVPGGAISGAPQQRMRRLRVGGLQ